jgi:hypothetical protein
MARAKHLHRVRWLCIERPPATTRLAFHVAADASWAAASDTGFIKMPNPKDNPKSSARDEYFMGAVWQRKKLP